MRMLTVRVLTYRTLVLVFLLGMPTWVHAVDLSLEPIQPIPASLKVNQAKAALGEQW